MKIHQLSNRALHDQLARLASEERRITLDILHHLRECERRRLYAERGHSSLFEYAIRELGYSESSAQRRISAMRALRDLPELERQVETGELKVTQLARVQTFLRAEKKGGKTYTQAERRELILETVGKSSRETEKLLTAKSPSFLNAALAERVRVVTPELTQISFMADEDLMAKLTEIRDLYAHRLPAGATHADVIRWMAEKLLKQKRRELEKETTMRSASVKKAPGKRTLQEKTTDAPADSKGLLDDKVSPQSYVKQSPLAAPQVKARYIPAPVRREVWRRDHGRCTYISALNGQRCKSMHRLEVDHIRPYARGGSSQDPENLRLLCRTHNTLESEKVFGRFIKLCNHKPSK